MTDVEDQLDNILDMVVSEKDEEPEKEPDRPNIGDEGWNEFILCQLRGNEKADKGGIRPKADGLIRILRQETGGRLMMTSNVISCTQDYACVTVTLSLPNGEVFSGTAECSSQNTKHPFYNYPSATAETRAMGRAAKRALGLVGITTAEEIGDTPPAPSNDENRTEGGINQSQIRFIDRQCKKYNIDVELVVQHILPNDVNAINDLSHAEALEVNKLLNDVREDDDLKAQFGEYDSDWKNSFAK